jgi:two-component system NarL family response regulator
MLFTYYGLEVDLHVPDDFPDLLLAPHVEVQLLRIIQEALTNVRKHAGVSQARLYLLADSDYARAIISDAGAGFDLTAAPDESGRADPHFGLTMMRERAASVNGTVDIRSRPGQGSQLTVKIPRALPPAGAADATLPWRVLLVDDHPMFLEGLRTLLSARGLNVVGLARNGEEAQAQARALLPDVILMDVDMPTCGGIEATRRIKAELPDTRIVMLTVSADDVTLFAALQAGASGYLLKNLADEDFYRFLKNIMRGETALSPEVAARILAEFKPPAAAPAAPEAEGLAALTPRQREVLDYAAQGLTYKEIGQRLHISENTTRYHMGKIIEVLQVESRRAAVELARRQSSQS